MCLGIPGRIVEILDEDIYLAKAEVGGVRRNINIGLVHHDDERIEIGDWVLIHVGFDMSKLDEAEAHSALRALEQIGEEYEQELEELKASQIEYPCANRSRCCQATVRWTTTGASPAPTPVSQCGWSRLMGTTPSARTPPATGPR